jgi:hypothetical protein
MNNEEVAFGQAERNVCDLFKKGTVFSFDGCRYVTMFSGKPTIGRGEPKTDIFIRAFESRTSQVKDIKISYKKANADFLENKMNALRAEEVFGPQWAQVLIGTTTGIQKKFSDRPRIYLTKYGHTEAGSITLGWKFELVRRAAGDLSGEIKLDASQKIDIYSGRNLSVEKRNASVNGTVIADSGVAEYLLNKDYIENAQDAIDSLERIVDFAPKQNMFFACKALNYRTLHVPPKCDGPRPLAVQVEWFVNRVGKLDSRLNFSNPLTKDGYAMQDMLKGAMAKIGVHSTNDLNARNCSVPFKVR